MLRDGRCDFHWEHALRRLVLYREALTTVTYPFVSTEQPPRIRIIGGFNY